MSFCKSQFIGHALGERSIAVAKFSIIAKDLEVDVHSAGHWRAQHTQTGANLDMNADGDEPSVLLLVRVAVIY